VDLGGLSEPLDHRRVDTDLIVHDVVTVDLDRGLVGFVQQFVMEAREVLDDPVPEPLVHVRKGSEPLVVHAPARRGHPHGHKFDLALRDLQRLVKLVKVL